MRVWLQRVACTLVMIAACALAAGADTIVLKTGRRIHATNVVEEGDHVSFETSAGRLSLPRSSVDHIERGVSTDMGAPGAGSAANGAGIISASSPPAPVTSADAEAIAKTVLAGGSIDRNYLAQLEIQAERGGKEAADRVAIGHHVAAQF